MKRGKNLKIFMMDGEATGRWECTLGGRTTKAYRIPRKYYKDCSDLEELHKPAVYLLLGDDDETGRPVVYVGETENAFSRLKDHEVKKDFWREAIAFIGQDDYLNKAHVKYLESNLYDLAIEVGRYMVINTVKPKAASISAAEQAEMDDFIDDIKTLTYALGHGVFQPLVRTQEPVAIPFASEDEYFYIEGKNTRAKMYRSEEGYIVCKDSEINLARNKSTPAWVIKKRNELNQEETLINNRLIRDVLFNTPSGASDFVTGNSTNGRNRWKNKNGVTLGEILGKEENS